MSATLAQALLDALDADALDVLAERLAPRLDRLRDRDRGGDAWLRGAAQIAEYIGAPRSRVFSLSSAGRIPVQRDGSALVARKSELDEWIRSGGGRRP